MSFELSPTPPPEKATTFETLDQTALEPLFKHPASAALETKLGVTIRDLFSRLFVEVAPYESVCICSPDWTACSTPSEYGTYYTCNEMHMLLYTYIMKRGTAIPLIEAEDHRINQKYASKTDAAFVKFFTELVMQPDDLEVCMHTVPGHGRTAMINEKHLRKAFRVFTEQPMKFKVQQRAGPITQPEKIVAFWFKDVEPKGYWDTEWEFMSKGLALCLCPDENYEF